MRNLTYWTLVIGAVIGLVVPTRVRAQSSDDFVIAVIPDTQAYTRNDTNNLIFRKQIEWILNNRVSQKIAYVLHEGDMTDHNSAIEWQRFASEMKRLNGVVPYALAVGNHDVLYDYNNRLADYTNFYQTFPLDQFRATNSSHKLSFEPNKLENSYYEFQAGGREWGVITLEWETRPTVLAWANSIVSANPDRLFIILTHAYMYHDNNPSNLYPSDRPELANTRYGQVPNTEYQWPPYVTSGETVWRELVSQHENILFVFSGHTLGTGTGRRVDSGKYGNKVYQMLANYQMYADGSLRLIHIYPSQKRFEVKTYSPYRESYRTDPYNQFGYTEVEELILGKSGDVNKDGVVNREDFELVRMRYRDPYTIFDYNRVIREYGK